MLTRNWNHHKTGAILFKQLKFSGLRALAWCCMGNHLHLLLELPDKETALALAITDRTVRREWVVARAWLQRQLGEE